MEDKQIVFSKNGRKGVITGYILAGAVPELPPIWALQKHQFDDSPELREVLPGAAQRVSRGCPLCGIRESWLIALPV